MAEDSRARLDRLYREMRQRICLLDWPPGARLSETELAAEFGTSRTPIRRALARLEDEGLLQSLHGVGTLVTDVDREEMARTYALRMELAELVGRLSPAPVTPAILARLDGFRDRAERLTLQPDARHFAQLNMDFFDFGLSLTENAALRETSERLYYRTARIWLQQIAALDLAEECDTFRAEVDETARALRAGDPMAAALVRRAHISMSARRLAPGD
ncbi:GntR family transcriptional regulator [Pseudooceanicola sp. 216_PA32_1]|uniref:GntR family transcriptional regulator n=1 Tax=Pseudooceanicola pacificus TaxID=2676438 RepID=A0A844W7M4_9RHOB|nr:GntR family transcriptional regulator [Pseudooceanicola pacificus]MWB76723.1 GntR family transcriptional regulator [Pseudooceanicola pacificus]